MTSSPILAQYPMVPGKGFHQKKNADPTLLRPLPVAIHPTGQDRLRQHPTPLPAGLVPILPSTLQHQMYKNVCRERQTLVYYLALSLCLHLAPFALFFLKIEPRQDPSLDDNASPVTMLFSSGPSAKSGMSGEAGGNKDSEQSNAAGSSSPLVPPSVKEPPTKPEQKPTKPEKPVPPHPQEHVQPEPTNAPPIKEDKGPLLSAEKEHKKIHHPKTQRPQRPVLPRPVHRPVPRPIEHNGNDSPLNHPQNYNFGSNDTGESRHSRRGRRYGSHAPIDMSIGPLVQNGQFRNRYATTLTTKGATSSYGSIIDRWVRKHLYYPDDALQKIEEGTVTVEMVVASNGSISNLKLIGSSGSDALDSGLLSVFRTRRLPPLPPNSPTDHLTFTATVHYHIIR